MEPLLLYGFQGWVSIMKNIVQLADQAHVRRPRTILFLCTGNYYRSRFAELLFNHLAGVADIAWRAESRGLATELGVYNVGPIAPVVIEALRLRGIPCEAAQRFPRQVQPTDFAAADLCIALDEQEHRPYVAARFAEWAQQVVYWHVQDLGTLPAEAALAEIERETRRLIERLEAEARRG
jgi:protein-tyrosine phosphatase